MSIFLFFVLYGSSDTRERHLPTHSFPPRRSSYLRREPRLVDRAVGFDMGHLILKGIAVRHDAVVDFLPLKYALEHLHDERGRNILELAVAGVERRHRALVR